MTWFTLLIQLVLPVALLLWLALLPLAGWFARGLQMISIGMVLLGIGLAGLWSMPPFWAPYLYGAVYLLLLLRYVLQGRHRREAMWQTPAVGSIIVVLVTLSGFGGLYLAINALQGRVLPAEAVVDIAPPFGPGHYLIAHGGSTPLINGHLATLDASVERFRPWRGQSKALDIFRITPGGLHKDGWLPTDPARYTTFGTPILAPCDGQVALVIDGIDDMPVPVMDREHMTGNSVAIDCGEFFIVLAHFRNGSIVVAAGEDVLVGDALGEMGNSGNTSEPHLHVHAQRDLPGEAPIAGEPLWLTIDGEFLVRNERLKLN